MPYDKSLAERIRAQLSRRKNVVEKIMFGGVGFLLRGNMLVAVWKDSLVVRVGPSAYEGALDERHVREFDITGRPMRGWVLVAADGLRTDAFLEDWIERALEFVDTLPAK